MAGKSTLFRTAVALAFSILVATPWAAGLSDEQEGASRVYCVKKVPVAEDEYLVQLSQQGAGYAPDSDEQCFEWWYSAATVSAYSALQELFSVDFPPGEIILTSDLEFGGYDDNGEVCVSGATAFYPFLFGSSGKVSLTSAGDSAFTVRGVCYIGGASEATFGGNLLTSIKNVNFENLRLESLISAGLLGWTQNDASVDRVRIGNAVVNAPMAGVLAASIRDLSVNEFYGYSIVLNAIPKLNDNESFSTPNASIGSLVGYVEKLEVVSAKLQDVYITYSPSVGTSYLDSSLPDRDAYVGGIVGHVTTQVKLHQVGLENMVLTDYADGDGINYVGGLIGKVDECDWFYVERTYTALADIICNSGNCVQGFGAGYIRFVEDPGVVSARANFHYSANEQDVTRYFAGMVVGDYLNSYGIENTTITDEFNKAGTMPFYSEELVGDEYENVRRDDPVALGNYRNAMGRISATENFVEESYTFDDPELGNLPNGVLDTTYMKSAKFIDILDNIGGVLTSGDVPWKYDDTHQTLYFDVDWNRSDEVVDLNVHRIVFMLDCIESGCLTESEERMLGQFNNYRMGTNEFEFVTDESGAITNTAWLEFAASLEQPNADRDPVHWESSNDNGPYKRFSADEAYDDDYTFKLMPGEAQEETTEEIAYAFFGKGIDYDQTIVELISYDGETVKNKGSQIDMMSYSGGSQPISLRAGKVMQIFSRNPVTTDGSDFKGWKVRAEMTFTTNETELKKIAFAGMDIPVDGDGYFSLGENWESLNARFEKALGENANALTESRSIALAIFPAGFEDINGVEDDGEKQEEVEVVYPALFWSGNAIQLAVKTDDFVNEEGAPFVSVMLENLNDEPLLDTLMEFPNGGWPEVFTWEKYPLAAGMYHVVAKIYNGEGDNPDVREWTFEVKDVIENDCGDCWQMVALSNVDFEKYEWNDNEVFYWWDEFAIYGKYWQYKEFTKKDSPEHVRGYWYHSLEGRPLVLKDEMFTGQAVWHLDSVNSGWNMVANPYGWKMKIGVAGQENRDEKPELEFWRWNKQTGQYDPPEAVEELEPYEAVWVKLNRGPEMDWSLPATPAFVDFVNEDGEIVHVKSLNKKGVLAKAAGADGWALQVELSDASGKMDSWNMLGAGKAAWDSEEPPAGMGNRVNLSIVDAGRRLAKSVKALGEDAYEWNVELSATSARVGYLKFAGIDGILASGLRVFVTVDGVTTEMHDGEKLQVMLSTTAKSANIRVAKSARKVVASTLQGLRISQNAGILQVLFDASAGLNGARSRVDVVDTKGSVVATVDFKAVEGSNRLSLEIPCGGLHVVRVVSGSQVALQKVLLK
ncbi:hypothetical protein SAMN05720761_10875 [Fibrobacter sp. UWCM]|uniref:hypothetical protein n=1 Tax=Fibrobacter sp. UWCM TaxID=1896208 RepID=UPI00091EFDCA|nr:hypothetical protein [Fibrobacter sp. UWCM]SHH07072.1 hypothetical protein SAMN05720761_10875 [Fibrobacter sp. UWCM]